MPAIELPESEWYEMYQNNIEYYAMELLQTGVGESEYVVAMALLINHARRLSDEFDRIGYVTEQSGFCDALATIMAYARSGQ